ncbi:MAG: hypothetical protein ACREIS_14805 [Nitrospiraceae bacterium]
MARLRGGTRELRAPVAWVGFEVNIELGYQEPAHATTNVLTAYSESMEPLFDFGWRPHLEEYGETGGLFLC